jgi:hypothetical protein
VRACHADLEGPEGITAEQELLENKIKAILEQ